MKQMKQTHDRKNDSNKFTVKGTDLRDVRGSSIRPSHSIPSKMDKMRDPKRMRKMSIDFDESDEMDSIETQQWEVFDYLQDNLKSDNNIDDVYCAEEFPPTLKVVDVDGIEFECAIEVMEEDFEPTSMREIKRFDDVLDSDMAFMLDSLTKCIRTWDYSGMGVKKLKDRNFGFGVYFSNDRGTKFLIWITKMV